MPVFASSRLLASKVVVPAPARRSIRRPRLEAAFERGAQSRLTLVSAPAGSGKTTAVVEWLSNHSIAAAWLTLDPNDSDPDLLVRYLAAAVARVQPEVGGELAAALDIDALDVRTACIVLLNAIAGLEAPLVLVLDDVQQIGPDAFARVLAFCVEHAPEELRVVMLTRSEPELPLPRLRARGQLTEIRRADLDFTLEEADALMRTAGVPLQPEPLGRLVARTEGWAVGLQMASLGLAGADPQAFVSAFAASQRFVLDYLLDEVLANVPADVRERLPRLSLVHEIDAPFVEALCETNDGAEFLSRLLALNLFVVRLDAEGQRFRLHQLFRTLLQRELEASSTTAERASLHRRAAAEYERRGCEVEALDHFIAAEAWSEAERIVLARSAVALVRADARRCAKLFRRLPPAVVDARPRLAVRSYALLSTLGADPLVLDERRIASRRALEAAPDRDADAELALFEILGQPMVDLGAARARLDGAATDLVDRTSMLSAQIHLNRAHLAMASDDFEAALVAVDDMAAAVRGSADPFTGLWARWYRALVHVVRGELEAGLDRLLGAREDIDEFGPGHEPPSMALGFATVAHALAERGEFDEASTWLERAQALCDPRMTPADAIEVVLTQAWFEALRDPNGCGWRSALERGHRLLRGTSLRERSRLGALEARILLDARYRGVSEPALRAWVGRPGMRDGTDPVFSTKVFPTTRPGFARALRGRVLTRLGHLDEAARDIEAGLTAAETAGRRVCAIEMRLTAAEHALRRGDRAAGEHVARALEHAASESIVAPFVGQLPAVRDEILATATRIAPPGFVARLSMLLAAGSTVVAPAEPLLEALSERELEVLRHLADGESNAEIARALYVAPSTIKTHLEHIYGKLGVGRRTAAVARARELSLL